MRNDNRKAEIIAFCSFCCTVDIYGTENCTVYVKRVISILNSFGEIFAQPFKITLCEDSVKAVLHFAFNLRYYFVGIFFFKEKLQTR